MVKKKAKGIEDYTVGELEALIAARKVIEQKPKALTLPKALYDQAMGDLVRTCRAYIDQLAGPKGTRDLEEYEHRIFARALELVYGGQIWKWVSQILK